MMDIGHEQFKYLFSNKNVPTWKMGRKWGQLFVGNIFYYLRRMFTVEFAEKIRAELFQTNLQILLNENALNNHRKSLYT